MIAIDETLIEHIAVQVDEVFGLRDWPMDVFVYTPQEVQRLSHIRGTLLYTIAREGRLLYERA